MADRPILFSAPMVRALLDGRKSQTRRVLRPRPEFLGGYGDEADYEEWGWIDEDGAPMSVLDVAPNGYVRGDRLWVREAFNAFQFSQDGDDAWPVKIPTLEECKEADELAYRYGAPQIVYRESDRARKWFADQKWRPAIHMPRWASRLTLTVTDVRVERLQDISAADAIAEGCHVYANSATIDCDTPDPRTEYRALWNSIHGPDAWDANPWVAAISFDVRRGNIDEVPK